MILINLFISELKIYIEEIWFLFKDTNWSTQYWMLKWYIWLKILAKKHENKKCSATEIFGNYE